MSVLNQSGDEQAECPLCMEALEVDDLNFYPCTCGYQICRFCWNRIREGENGLCPACRKAYPENPADFTPLSQEQVAALKTEKRAREQQRRNKSQESRRQLSSVRVVQKNLVFVVGLPVRLADPEILKRPEYFGKYGKIHKVVINHSTTYAGSQGPSASAYVTYVSSADALRAIQNVNNVTIDGRVLKGSLGTTKYCANFMRNQPCPKPDCMYLHELGDPHASFTKEEMHQGLHQMYEKKLHEQLIAATAAAANSNSGTASNGSSTNSGNPGSSAANSIMMNGNHGSNSSGPSSNSSSTSSLSSNPSTGAFIPSAVVTSSSINIHNSKSKSNSSNGGTSGGVVLSSSSSSTSSSCSRDTWPSLGSSSPPLHSSEDSNPSPQPSSNNSMNHQLRNNSVERQGTTNKQHENNVATSNTQQTNGKSSNNKSTSKNNNKENTNTTNQNCDSIRSNSSNANTSSKGNASKKGNKNKKESEKQSKANKKDTPASSSTSETSNTEKKKSDKDKNKSSEQNNHSAVNEKAFKNNLTNPQTQVSSQKQQSNENTDLDADERHSLIDGHDLLEGSDHSLLEDDDHGLLKDSPPRNIIENGSINLLKKHPDMMNLVGPQSLFGASKLAPQQQPHNISQLKDFSELANGREHQPLFNVDRTLGNSSAFLEKEILLFRERQQKELLLKQEYLARQQLFNAMNSDPTKFMNLDPKEQLLLQQRLRQQQQQNALSGNMFSPFGMRMDGSIPQQFGLQQQQIPNQSRMNGLLNDSNHMLTNGLESHGQGLANSLSSGNIANNLNAAGGLVNSLSASNLSGGSKLLGAGSGNVGSGMSEGRYVGENNMDRFFLDFHRNQQLKGGRSGPLLPPEAPSLAYIESQALQRKYGLMQNGIQDTLGQQLSQLHAMGNNMFQCNNHLGNISNGPMGNGGMSNNGSNVAQQQQQQQQINGQQGLGNGLTSDGQTGGIGNSQNNREDDLDFEWLNERQKLFAELIENDMMQQGHPNYNENMEMMQQRARHPPQGFTHMNAFGIGLPRPQPATGLSQNTGMVSDWTQMDPAIVGVSSNTVQQQQQQQQQQHSLMARFRNITLQQQQIEAQRLQNGLIMPQQQQHNMLTAQQQLQYQQQQQQRKLMAAAAAAQQQQQTAQQQQQLPNSFWVLPSEQQINNYQNRNGFYSTATQSIQNNGDITPNNKYNVPMAQAFASTVSGNPSVNPECIESK